jgi:hypothetical protein
MSIRSVQVNTTGADGAAVGSETSDWELQPCVLETIKVDYHASAPVTTDVTISEAGGLGRVLLTLTNVKDDGWYYPRHTTHDDSGADVGSRMPYILEGAITVSVAGCNALAPAVNVRLQVIENHHVR